MFSLITSLPFSRQAPYLKIGENNASVKLSQGNLALLYEL